MKRIIALIMAVLLLITGCGKEISLSPSQKERKQENSDIEYFLNHFSTDEELDVHAVEELMVLKYGDSNFHKDPGVEDYSTIPYTPVSEEMVEKVNRLGEDLVEFVNRTYELNWRYEPVEVTKVDSTEANDKYDVLGRYVLKEKRLLISQKLYEIEDTNLFIEILAHELFHYLCELNTGSVFFVLANNGLIVGNTFHEAITESVAYRYMEEVHGISAIEVHNGNVEQSGYELLMFNLKALSIATDTDIIKEVLHGRITDVNKSIDTYVSAGFVFLLNEMDKMMANIRTDNTPAVFTSQVYLAQLIFFIAPKSKDKELIKLTEEYILRIKYINVKLRSANNAIAAWSTFI